MTGMTGMTGTDLRERCAIDDVALTMLHAAAFDETPRLRPWGAQLERHSLTWLGAFEGVRMIGFANLAWDGGVHAFLVDVLVAPDRRRRGTGRALVAEALRLATEAGCAWLHADPAPAVAAAFAAVTPSPVRLHRATRDRRGDGGAES